MELKKIIVIMVFVMLSLFIIWQVFLLYTYKGNLHFTICNESEIRQMPIEIYIDGKIVVNEVVNDFSWHEYSFYSMFITPINHTVVVKMNDDISREIKFNSVMFTHIYVDYQGADCQSGYGVPIYIDIEKWLIWILLM